MKTAFITGTSSGLGHGLPECLSHQGWQVYGCSRRGCDLVILNSGILGEIRNLTDTPLEDLKQVMEGRRNPAR